MNDRLEERHREFQVKRVKDLILMYGNAHGKEILWKSLKPFF